MDKATQKAYDSTRDFGKKAFRSGCYAPFVSLYFTTRGDVLACCKNWTYILGNIARQRLDEIWNGGKITTLRESLVNYRFEAGCEFCEWQITGGDQAGTFPLLFEEFPVQSMAPKWPTMIEFAGSNTCNFACIMCYGELSSTIRAQREGLPPLAKVYSEEFFQDLRKYLPHLQRAKFLGGEPFLSHECFRIWDMMIEDQLPISCHVTTNGSQYNAKVERILESLPISLSISIDGATKETLEKIRVHANYETVLKNVQRFREYTRRRGTYMGFSYCLMPQNWHEFGDFLLFAESLECEVFVNTVIDPSHCSLYTLPPAELARIADTMEKQDSALSNNLHLNRKVWEDHVRKLRHSAHERQAERLTRMKHIAGEAWRNNPESTWHHIGTAWELLSQGSYAAALQEATKTPRTNPHYYYSVTLCGHIRRLMGDLAGAEHDLECAIQFSRRRPEAFINRAWLRLDQNRVEEGLADAMQARNLLKDEEKLEVDICEILGLLYSRQGNLTEATKAYDHLLTMQPTSPRVRVLRGLAFQTAGQWEQALEEAEAALALDPNYVEAIQLREQL